MIIFIEHLYGKKITKENVQYKKGDSSEALRGFGVETSQKRELPVQRTQLMVSIKRKLVKKSLRGA